MRRLLTILALLLLASPASALLIKPNGATDVTTFFCIRTAADGTATTGATITNIDLQYCEEGAAPSAKVDATALAATDSDHADNKAIEIDATDQPGLYRVDWPDAAFDGGVGKTVVLTVKLASSFTEHLLVQLSPPVNVTEWEGNADANAQIESQVGDSLGGGTGTALTAIPWNSDWDAEVESEVDDSIGGGTGTALTAVPWNSDWDA